MRDWDVPSYMTVRAPSRHMHAQQQIDDAQLIVCCCAYACSLRALSMPGEHVLPPVESDRRLRDLAFLLALQRLLHDWAELRQPERTQRHVRSMHSGLGHWPGRRYLLKPAVAALMHCVINLHNVCEWARITDEKCSPLPSQQLHPPHQTITARDPWLPYAPRWAGRLRCQCCRAAGTAPRFPTLYRSGPAEP